MLAALVLGAWLLLRPIIGAGPGLVIGSPKSEAPRHFWGLWATARGLLDWGPFVAHLDVGFPESYTRHLMDPVNLVFFLPGYWAGGGGLDGAVAGWTLLHAAWPVVGGIGGWLMARALLGDRPGAPLGRLVAALACATAPWLLSTPWLGRTEYLPAALYPLHLWALRRAIRTGGWGATAAAGLSLGATALGGWYLAVWLALLQPFVAAGLVLQARRDGRGPPLGGHAARLVAVAALATLMLAPAAWALFAYPPPVLGEAERLAAVTGISTPPTKLLPFTGSEGLPGTDLPAYPGAALALLAAVGAALDRRARPWLAAAAAVLVLSLGPYLVWDHRPDAMDGALMLPAGWLEWLVPPLRFLWGWNRIGALATAPLAAAAAFGAASLSQRLRGVRVQVLVIILLGLVVDHAQVRAPAGISGSSFPPALPAPVAEALARLPDGALLQLPFDDFYMTWQPIHGRPIAESLEIEVVRQESWTTQQVERLLFELPRDAPVPDEYRGPLAAGCLRQDAARLAAQGFSVLMVHREAIPDRHLDVARFLAEGLGEPAVDEPTLVAWTLPASPPAGRYDCPVRDVAPTMGGPPPPPGSPP